MAAPKKPTAFPPDAVNAALAIVAAAMRAEAAVERSVANPTMPGYTARVRMARVLDALAERIAPAGTPA